MLVLNHEMAEKYNVIKLNNFKDTDSVLYRFRVFFLLNI